MLHLHHLENSRSFRIVWLLEELNIPYQLTRYERTKAYLAPSQLKEIHPSGKAPILVVDDRPLVESGFIIEYVLKHYDTEHTLKPSEDNDAAWENYTFWMHFAEASAMPPLVMRLVFAKIVDKSPMLIKPVSKMIRKQVEDGMIRGNINMALALMEQHLQDNHWFAGESFSAADIQMHFVVAAANARPNLDSIQYVHLLNWLKRCETRPAFQQAVAKGGKLDF